MLYHIISEYVISYYIACYHIILHYVISKYCIISILCYAMLCKIISYCMISYSYHVMLYYIIDALHFLYTYVTTFLKIYMKIPDMSMVGRSSFPPSLGGNGSKRFRLKQSRLQPAVVNADVQKAAGRVHSGLHPAIPNQQFRVGICKGPCLLRINALLDLIIGLAVWKQ